MLLAYWYVCVCVREGVLPIMASTGKLRPKGVPPFVRFQAYERLRVSRVQVYLRVAKYVILVGKNAQKG